MWISVNNTTISKKRCLIQDEVNYMFRPNVAIIRFTPESTVVLLYRIGMDMSRWWDLSICDVCYMLVIGAQGGGRVSVMCAILGVCSCSMSARCCPVCVSPILDSVRVSSVITPALRSEIVWGWAFSDNKRCLLLLSVCFGAMTTLSFYQPIGGWFWKCPRTWSGIAWWSVWQWWVW